MLIDTHCHIFKEYYDDIDGVMNNLNNVKYVINNACNLKTSMEILELSKVYKNMYCVIGIHPEDNYNDLDEVLLLAQENLNDNKLLGIGEIGLDYYYEKDKKDEQIILFKKQLDFAQKYNLPVIIHSREATNDTINILKQYNLRGIIHCFNGSLETAKEYIKMGYKIGVNGVVTFKNCKLIDVLKNLSIKDFVFETDSPYMTPVPFRGKKNYPSYVEYVVDFVSKELNIDKDILIRESYNNILEVFNLQ